VNSSVEDLEAARHGDESAFRRLVAPFRRELRAHCYRMAGSIHEADDLLQESLLKAWRGLASFEGRSSLRTWLYTVTTRACLDVLDKRSSRVLPQDLQPAADPNAPTGPPRMEPIWIEPCPADVYRDAPESPEAAYSAKESVALAFLVALQLLPAKQRAVLILRDVLGWQASDCADLLELSVAAVNSALQRARETLQKRAPSLRDHPARAIDDAATRTLLERYVRAWELADVPLLVSLLKEDAKLAMPPLPEWIEGKEAIGASIAGMVLGPDARGSFRLVASEANGCIAFAAYQRKSDGEPFSALALHVLELEGDHIASITAFLDPRLFGAFGLAATLSG
jgi:RNA polymerase sigma-70 factor (ECF subfamily)